MIDRVVSLLNALAGPPRPAQVVTSYTVPVTAGEDDDPEAAMAWLDQTAQHAGDLYAAQQWPGGGLR